MPKLRNKNKNDLKTERLDLRITAMHKKHIGNQGLKESDYIRFLIQKDLERKQRMEKVKNG